MVKKYVMVKAHKRKIPKQNQKNVSRIKSRTKKKPFLKRRSSTKCRTKTTLIRKLINRNLSNIKRILQTKTSKKCRVKLGKDQQLKVLKLLNITINN